MHKGIIFLTIAESKEEALSKVQEFLDENHKNSLFDWYQVGGRWVDLFTPEGQAKVENNYTHNREDRNDRAVKPLKEVLEIVTKYKRDLVAAAATAWGKMLEEKEQENSKQREKYGNMSSYYAREYAHALDKTLCNDSCVFNIEEGEAEIIPDQTLHENYFAVVIDIHY